MSAVEGTPRVDIPPQLVEASGELLRQGLEFTHEAYRLAREADHLAGAVDLLRPELEGPADDKLAMEWGERSGLQPFWNVLMDAASVICDTLGFAPNDRRPLREVEQDVDAALARLASSSHVSVSTAATGEVEGGELGSDVGLPEALGGLVGLVIRALREDLDHVVVAECRLVEGLPAVTARRGGDTAILLDSEANPAQRLRALLAELDGGLVDFDGPA